MEYNDTVLTYNLTYDNKIATFNQFVEVLIQVMITSLYLLS